MNKLHVFPNAGLDGSGSIEWQNRELPPQVSEELGVLLYHGLEKLGLLYRKDGFSPFWFSESSAYLDADCQRLLTDSAYVRYRKLIRMNAAKFFLACRSMGKPVCRASVSAAVRYVLLGCLLDDLIDTGTAKEGQDSLHKMNWAYCGPYFEAGIPPKEDSVIDKLMSQTGRFYQRIRRRDCEAYWECLSLLKRAIYSEIYVTTGENVPESVSVVDKSVLFTALGFLLAVSGDASPDEETVFLSVGNAFRILDDLCDIEEDLCRGQRNSIVTFGQPPQSLTNTVKDRVETQFQELEQELNFLRQTVSAQFLDFLYYEIRDWTLSNPGIRKKTLC